MNIFGIGTDIVNIKRIQNSLKKNKNFKKRIFTKFEAKICEKRGNKIRFNYYPELWHYSLQSEDAYL